MADDVLVCASELATNAVLHSHSRLAGGTFTVRGKVNPGNYFWLESKTKAARGLQRSPIPSAATDSTSCAAWPTTGVSKGDHDGRTVWVRFDWLSP